MKKKICALGLTAAIICTSAVGVLAETHKCSVSISSSGKVAKATCTSTYMNSDYNVTIKNEAINYNNQSKVKYDSKRGNVGKFSLTVSQDAGATVWKKVTGTFTIRCKDSASTIVKTAKKSY